MRTTERQRKKLTRGFVTTVVLALLLPLCAGAGEKKWKDALLIAGPVKGKDNYLGEGYSQVRTKNWVYVVKVGDYKYVGDVGRTGGLFNPKGKPKTNDWPANSPIQVHFHHRAGSLYMDLKSPTGKEETAWVISKVGPDGKELCGKIKCTKTPGEDDD